MISSREAFEKTVTGKWPDSYTFTQFNGNKDYRDEVLQGMWMGWQASRQALGCEPVAWIVHCPSGYKKRPHAVLRSDYNVEDPEFWVGGKPPSDATVTRLYTHPASVDAPNAEYIRVLQDAFDIIQADANTKQNYGSLCRISSVLANLKASRRTTGSA